MADYRTEVTTRGFVFPTLLGFELGRLTPHSTKPESCKCIQVMPTWRGCMDDMRPRHNEVPQHAHAEAQAKQQRRRRIVRQLKAQHAEDLRGSTRRSDCPARARRTAMCRPQLAYPGMQSRQIPPRGALGAIQWDAGSVLEGQQTTAPWRCRCSTVEPGTRGHLGAVIFLWGRLVWREHQHLVARRPQALDEALKAVLHATDMAEGARLLRDVRTVYAGG